MAITIEKIDGIKNKLGEGPVWDVAEKALYWIDGQAPAIYRLDPKSNDIKSWKMPKQIGSFALREKGGAVCALSDGFYLFDFASGSTKQIGDPVAKPGTTFNDGKTDARGRFIAGTLDAKFANPVGSIFSLDASLKCSMLEPAIGCTNGPCFSPDNRTFYCADSVSRTISAYDYDLVAGTVSNKRLFAAPKGLGGVPDGATVDAEGHLWSAIAGGGKIVCYNPDGSIARTVEVPVPIITSVMFGGDNLDVMYATSIGERILDMEPGADGGSLFAIKGLGVKGKPEPRFAG
ncbi:MAG: SMP-30/gluconolactonase/LRE family protein [Candidatus Binatus sp.]|uniref:SMP-30/gluconolactonase/LRE family protein n=1 Tax=Candidatus Binatus sp. TaxID=2811406 RepID=UPI0027270C95|nr:SMP-30/gluconolactonase/LRE family protein [Candidatus Binatus sp.]MDO8431156.1 SMP-30/gluconolactonase/LRE family protein [Candidatus Binatus sp.]